MTRFVALALLVATVAVSAAPAFALSPYPNCDAGPKADWARCIIRSSKTGGE